MTLTGPVLTVAGEPLELVDPFLVVAGYTARDQAAVRAHIDELAEIGVPPPPSVPMYYPLDPVLLTTDKSIRVPSGRTSGEVEPVVVWSEGRRYLGVGSDHTDRGVETESVAKAKAAAPKPIGAGVLPFDAVDDWDRIEIACRVDGQRYQRGQLSTLLHPQRLIDGLPDLGAHTSGVMFCGTLPLVTGEFVYGTTWELELRLPDGRALTHEYSVEADA